jgi:molecular chaperone HtpG
MKEGQEAIWYVTAGSHAQARNNPAIEALKARGIEVILMHDRIDEWMVSYLHAYAGKTLKNAAKGELDLGKLGDSADQARREEATKAAAPLVEKLKARLGDRVQDVRVSPRLTETPSLLVVGEHDMASHMQRLLREAGHEVPSSKPILEINPSHGLLRRFEQEGDEARAADLALVLLRCCSVRRRRDRRHARAVTRRTVGAGGAAGRCSRPPSDGRAS